MASDSRNALVNLECRRMLLRCKDAVVPVDREHQDDGEQAQCHECTVQLLVESQKIRKGKKVKSGMASLVQQDLRFYFNSIDSMIAIICCRHSLLICATSIPMDNCVYSIIEVYSQTVCSYPVAVLLIGEEECCTALYFRLPQYW